MDINNLRGTPSKKSIGGKQMSTQENSKKIKQAILRLFKKDGKKDWRMLYIVKTPRGSTQYMLCGKRTQTGFVTELNSCTIYDIINELFVDNMGFDVSIKKDPVNGSIGITLWKQTEKSNFVE